jgi:hypothetical protein
MRRQGVGVYQDSVGEPGRFLEMGSPGTDDRDTGLGEDLNEADEVDGGVYKYIDPKHGYSQAV